jgi:isopentenyl-diphosphate delta-isomerase
VEKERVVLVDKDGREVLNRDGTIRTIEKLEAHVTGALHRAVSVFIFNGDDLLLQKRASTKYHSAGLWSNTCCTHPRLCEAPLDAARRRLREEMGIRCDLQEIFQLTYHADLGEGLVESEYDHIMVGYWHGKPQPDPKEVSDWRWISVRQLEDEISVQPNRFTYWLRCCIGDVLKKRPRNDGQR